MDAYRILKEA